MSKANKTKSLTIKWLYQTPCLDPDWASTDDLIFFISRTFGYMVTRDVSRLLCSLCPQNWTLCLMMSAWSLRSFHYSNCQCPRPLWVNTPVHTLDIINTSVQIHVPVHTFPQTFPLYCILSTVVFINNSFFGWNHLLPET